MDFKKRKTALDINFLETCRDGDVIPRFLQFRTANVNLKNSSTYKDCQKLLLQEEIEVKQKKLDEVNKTFLRLKKDLHGILSYFDFLHMTSLFFDPNINAIEKMVLKQNIELSKIFEENIKHDPKDIIHNYSSHILTPDQENLLIKGLNFALPPKNFDTKITCYHLNFCLEIFLNSMLKMMNSFLPKMNYVTLPTHLSILITKRTINLITYQFRNTGRF